jgi:ATP-dependent Clp protease ATP-binding subunit ClpA
MLDENWSARHITDSAQHILGQVPSRASDRGLYVVDRFSLLILVLWSLVLWEGKLGRIALEKIGLDLFELAHRLDGLLTERAREHPVAYDHKQRLLVLVNTGEPYQPWDFAAILEPLLQQAEHEARELGHDYVGSEHLVLAICASAGSPLSDLLQQYGMSRQPVKEAVLNVLQL